MAVGDQGGVRFRAFLSYSHKDANQARWLHRRLEGYRLPRRLVGSEGAHGPVPARLAPIFRDREELPAAGDLSETVRAALAASDNLIVICSPHAAASPWVAKEIAGFRALHPDRPVFAAIVTGEPGACFPNGLAIDGVEPLAADLRKQGDGRRLGLLKLVAGLAGVGLDALVQRDAQRRLRRVTAVTVGALLGLLITSVLAIVAVTARAEAERQRAEAEGLVEFMLTDLRDTLKGVGRLDAMAAVNGRALAYYGDRKDIEALSDESLARRARILHAIGEDELAQHRLDEALRTYREARQATAELVARAPDNPERLLEHARSDFGIGRVHELREDWALAQRHYTAFAAAADRLLSRDPANPEFMMRSAAAVMDVGTLQLNGTHDPTAAQRSFEKAVRLLARADRLRPNDEHVLPAWANAYGWLADSFYAREMWCHSLAHRRSQYAIALRVHEADPKNSDAVFRLAAARRGLVYSLARAGERDEAYRQLRLADSAIGGLVALEPSNAEWRSFRDKLAADLRKIHRSFPRTGRLRCGSGMPRSAGRATA